MNRKMFSSLNTRFAGMETNKLYVLPTTLNPRFKVKVFSSSVAVIQARQCLTEEFILFQSASAEASSELADPPFSKTDVVQIMFLMNSQLCGHPLTQ